MSIPEKNIKPVIRQVCPISKRQSYPDGYFSSAGS